MQATRFLPAVALAISSGCLWFLAVTPFDYYLLAWVASVPMLLAIDRAPNLRRALFIGWLAGVVETAGGFYWLLDLTQRFAGFPWIAAAAVLLLFCAARALIFLLFTAIVYPIRRNTPVRMTALAPVVMVGCELLVPQIFPCGQWISQAWHPLVIQIAEFTGPFGVTALLMLVNGALYDLLVDGAAARNAVLCAAVLLGAALGFGALRMRQIDAQVAAAPRLSVGLVQPNFAYSVTGDETREEILRQLDALQQQSARLERSGAQLLVWSEGSFPIAVPRDFSADFTEDSLAMIRRGFRLPTIIGADMYDAAHDYAYNSAVLLDHDGRVAGYYDKVRLLAFGEYIPGIETFPWLRGLLPEGAGRFTPGAGPGVLSLELANGQSWRLGPVICYEDILPGFLRRVGQLHPDLLVNLTSDSWFGAQAEPWEHMALSVYASVELRVSLVRAVNSGVSSLIDPNGRVLRQTYAVDPYRHPHAADGIVVSAPKMPGGRTAYVAVGNLFGYLCIGVTLLCGLWALARRRPLALRRSSP